MICMIWSLNGSRRRSSCSLLRTLADEIIFMAPVSFSLEATVPMRVLSSLSVAI